MKLIDKYLPSDYSDSVSKRIKPVESLTPDGIFEAMFCNFPKPVAWLMKMRNVLVKPLGLQGGYLLLPARRRLAGGFCHHRSEVQ